MRYPAVIKIGYKNYEVSEVPALQMPGIDGHTRHDPPQIIVADGTTPRRCASTLLHEVFHGIHMHYGMNSGSWTEERIVETYANGLATVIHDNPGFAAWLALHLESND